MTEAGRTQRRPIVNWSSIQAGEPTRLEGEWSDRRVTFFRHEGDPLAAKFALERMTHTLLAREPGAPERLAWVGTSRHAPDARTVRLALDAVIDGRGLYSFGIDRTAPRAWTTGTAFTAECERSFAFWRAKLDVVVAREVDWQRGSAPDLRALIIRTIEAEALAAALVEDPAPIAALQRAIVEDLRAGSVFRDAHKEGITRFEADGAGFVRIDIGDQPNIRVTYGDDASVLAALRRYFDGDASAGFGPHRPSELHVWTWIAGRRRLP